MSKLDAIKDKLRKLQQHQQSADELGNEHEAAAFAAKIQQMLMEYQIEMADLDQHVVESIDVGEEFIYADEMTNRNEGKWVQMLFTAVAKSNSCIILISPLYGNTLRLKLIGHEINREAVKYIVNELIPLVRNAAKYQWKGYQGREKRNTFIRGFLIGACQTIHERLWDDFTKVKYEDARANDVVLNKEAALDNYMAKHYPKLGKGRGARSKGGAGMAAGRETGRHIGIRKNVGPGGNRLLGN